MSARKRKSASVAKFTKGDLVRLSEIGKKRNPRFAMLTGTVTGSAQVFAGYHVRIEGSKRSLLLHENYIEKMPDCDGAD